MNKLNTLSKYFRCLILVSLVCIFIINLPGIALAQAETGDNGETTGMITLSVTSEPTGATVVVDRIIQGVTPINIKMDKGKHLIRLAINQNWHPFIEEREINEDTTMNVVLVPVTHYSYQEGKLAYNQGKWKAAKVNFMKSISPSRGKIIPESYFYLGLLARRDGDYADMEKNLKEFINYNPTSGDFSDVYPKINEARLNYGVQVSYFLLGEYYRDSYKWSEAATEYKLSIPEYKSYLDSKVAPSYENINKYRAITRKNPKDYKSLVQLGYLYEMKGKLFEAMLSYRDAAKALYNRSGDFMVKYGKILGW